MSYELELKEIEENKGMISYAIAMAVANGKEEEAAKLYSRFLQDIKNSTIFFLELSSFESKYKIERRRAINKISEFLGYDARPYIDRESKISTTNHFENPSTEVALLYKKNAKRYARFGITFERLEKLYSEGKINELESLINEVNKYQRFKFIQEFSMSSQENKEIPIIGKQFDELKNRFKLSTLDDLLLLSIEIDSFFADTSKINDKQLGIIEKNKNAFRDRIGASKDYVIDKESADTLKEQINQVYNFNLYKQAMDNSNIREFFAKNNFPYTGENLEHVLGMLMSLVNAVAICGQNDYGDGRQKHCFYKADLLLKSITHQNMIITHEFIHALERIKKDEKVFWKSYRAINEAMTEYFARRAQQYLDDNILNSHLDNGKEPYRCAYTNMLPLVEVLEKSPYWSDFLDAKFNGDVEALTKKIGRANLIKIRDLFISCNCLDENDLSSQKMYANNLEKFLKKVYARRNK